MPNGDVLCRDCTRRPSPSAATPRVPGLVVAHAYEAEGETVESTGCDNLGTDYIRLPPFPLAQARANSGKRLYGVAVLGQGHS